MVKGSFRKSKLYELQRYNPVITLQFWKALAHDSHLIPNFAPEIVASVEVVKGAGGIPVVDKINFIEKGEGNFRTEIVNMVDEDRHTLKLTVINGVDLGTKFNSYSTEIFLSSSIRGGGVGVRFTVEYDTIDGTPLDDLKENQILKDHINMLQALDEHFYNEKWGRT